MMDIVLLWLFSGIVGHIWHANQMGTWCGTPVWKEPTTYVLFFPAMFLGPLVFIFVIMGKP